MKPFVCPLIKCQQQWILLKSMNLRTHTVHSTVQQKEHLTHEKIIVVPFYVFSTIQMYCLHLKNTVTITTVTFPIQITNPWFFFSISGGVRPELEAVRPHGDGPTTGIRPVTQSRKPAEKPSPQNALNSKQDCSSVDSNNNIQSSKNNNDSNNNK